MKTTGAALFFVAFALALTAPVWRAPNDLVIGDITKPGLSGELFHQWDFRNQVHEGRIATYYQSDRVSWPAGQDLRRFIGFSLHLFFYLPLTALGGLILPYNLLLAMTLALNGFAAFLLFRKIAGSYWPGLACGILFALSPFAFLKLEQGFLQKVILWWLPLFLLALLRYFDGCKRRDAACAGAAWLGALLTYAPYAWYAALAGLTMTAATAIADRRTTCALRQPSQPQQSQSSGLLRNIWPLPLLALIGVIFLVLLLPSAGIQPPEGIVPVALAEAPIGSLDLFHAFRFFPYTGFREPVASLPLGIPISAAVFAVFALIRRRPRSGVFSVMALVFLIVALGPFLSCNGEITSRLPLPYHAIASFAPWGKRLGYSIRALPFFELSLLALAALALSSGTSSNKTSKSTLLMSLVLLGFGLAEKAWLLPELYPPTITSTNPPPYVAWLRDNARVVLHLPFNVRGDEPHEYCLAAALSNTRMLNSYLDFRADGFPVPPLPDPAPDMMADYLAALHDAGATHIAIHLDALLRPTRHWRTPDGREMAVEDYGQADVAVFQEWCGQPLHATPDHVLIYAVPEKSVIQRIFQERNQPASPTQAELALLQAARRRSIHRQSDIAEQVRSFENRLIVERFIDQEIRPATRLDEDALQEYFFEHHTEFQRDPQIRLFHLLVPLPPSPSPAQWSETYDRAQTWLHEISGPIAHALALAETINRYSTTNLRMGDLGYIGPGHLPPEVDEELFSLRNTGDIAMFESKAGFHLYRITDMRPGRNFTFDEVREAVRDQAERESLRKGIELWLKQNSTDQPALTNDMVHVPGGSFLMGSTPQEIDRSSAMAQRFVGRTRKVKRAWFEDETLRLVTVAPFELDRHEVTVAEYKVFLKATDRPMPELWEASAPPDSWPATGISWSDAAAYAHWAGKRLPTAEEWEWAARGAERRFFPWGDAEPDGTRANYADRSLNVPHNDPENNDGFAGLAPVGSFPAGATPEGVFDLAGNAREWTATQAFGIQDPTDHHIWSWENRPEHLRGPEHRPELMRVVKGGSFDSAADDLRCADMRMLPPDANHESLGFRCARDAF